LFKAGASYEGGHPGLLGRHGKGDLTIWPERVEFVSRKVRFAIPLNTVTDVELGEAQRGVLRGAAISYNVAFQALTPMVNLTCQMDGATQRLRFHIHALTLPGESKRAREVLDHLNALRSAFAATEQPASPVRAGDVAGELRELAKLRDEGILTQVEFESSKARLLEKL
jgi:hypothetical protein